MSDDDRMYDYFAHGFDTLSEVKHLKTFKILVRINPEERMLSNEGL